MELSTSSVKIPLFMLEVVYIGEVLIQIWLESMNK